MNDTPPTSAMPPASPPSQRLGKWTGILFLLATDVALFNLSLYATFYLTFLFSPLGRPPEDNLWSFFDLLDPREGGYLLILPAAVFTLFDVSCVHEDDTAEALFTRIFQATFALLLGVVALVYLKRWGATDTGQHGAASFPARVIVAGFFMNLALLTTWHLAFDRIVLAFSGRWRAVRRIWFLGNPAGSVLARIQANPSPQYVVSGYFGPATEPATGLSRLGDIADLDRLLQPGAVDDVFAEGGTLDSESLMAAARACLRAGLPLRVIASPFIMTAATASPVFHNGLSVITLGETSIQGWNYVFKRLIDLAVSAGLILLTLPVQLAACLAILIDTKGWPIFVQSRVGQFGRPFRLYKLRTMRLDAAGQAPPLTEAEDPRITPVGRWLRKTSIDELPQLFNVLKGDMSLIGPRAVVPYVVEHFDEWERISLQVKPGITGLAQVSGRSALEFVDKSLLNLYYIRNYSLLLDLKILIQTILIVISMKGTGGTIERKGAGSATPDPGPKTQD